MPVTDHPVSAMTRRTGREPYGCSNAVRRPGYWVMVRQYRSSGLFEMVQQYVKDEMSHDCRYDATKTDPRCDGCRKSGENHAI